MNEYYFETLIANFLAKEISETEEKELMEWIKRDPANQIAFDETKMIWEGAIPETIDFSNDQSNIWENIDNLVIENTDNNDVNPIIRKLSFFRLRNIAATIAIFVGIGLWWMNAGVETSKLIAFETGNAMTKDILLPDGSKIILNSNSKLTYQSDFEIRDVELEGEAFFEIARDESHPFSIHSNGALTQVLGTSFNIRAYPNEDEVEITVSTGKVAFSKEKTTDKVVLIPGNTGVLDTKKAKVIKLESKPNELAWKTKELIFDNTGMGNVLKTLKRYYNLDISLENRAIYNCHFTGHFKNANIDEVLKALAFALELESEKKDQELIFKGNGCD